MRLRQDGDSARVLLCTAHFGDGHQQVAAALTAAYEAEGCAVQVVDCLRSAHPQLSRWSETTFHLLTQHAPVVYGWSHNWTRRIPNDHWFWASLAHGAAEAAAKAVQSFRPHIVLQLFPDQTLRGPFAPWRPQVTGMVLTDFSLHARWFCPGVDVYYLPHDSLLSSARRFVRDRRRASFRATGIPLRRQFETSASDVSRPDTAPRTRVVIATGGRGVFPHLDDVLERILEADATWAVEVLCGRNEAMRVRVEDFAQAWRAGAAADRVKAIPFVERVVDHLRQARFAVVKPGGVTVAECLASACPMVFWQAAAGQERDNAAFVERMGAGWMADDIAGLERALARLAQQEVALEASRTAAWLGRPDATARLVADTLGRLAADRT
ncbi:MAG: galactosyldiacylglycerol synthase [Alicyclobacillus sp.]|nr:galactosyldiacylglycerol synthase [Alicyclobacillus sp.]